MKKLVIWAACAALLLAVSVAAAGEEALEVQRFLGAWNRPTK